MDFLTRKVHLKDRTADGRVLIGFGAPTADEMAGAGLNPEGAGKILGAAWWDEMVADVVETPDICDPADPPDRVLQYASDVVSEYIRKRVQL